MLCCEDFFYFFLVGGWLNMKWQECVGYCWAVTINWVPFIYKWSCIRILILACRWLMVGDLTHPILGETLCFGYSVVYGCYVD